MEDNDTVYFCDRDYTIPLDIDRDTGKSFLETILTTFIDLPIVNAYTYEIVIVSALADLLEVSIYQNIKNFYWFCILSKIIGKAIEINQIE